MKGDSGTVLPGDNGTPNPNNVTRPKHWPDLEELDHLPEDQTTSVSNETAAHPKPATGFAGLVKQHSTQDIRAALQSSYPDMRDLCQVMVDQVQKDIAVHEVTPKPNDVDGLDDWNTKSNQLTGLKVAFEMLHDSLPTSQPDASHEVDTATIKERLFDLMQKLDRLKQQLDEDNGTYGNLWKLGVIGVGSQLLALLGIPVATGAPIAAGYIGITTIRILVGNKG